MRIGIDARMCGIEQGGIGRYVEQLIIKLAQIDRENSYTLFVRPENTTLPVPLSWKIVSDDSRWYTVKEQIKFLKTLNSNPVDIMHFPHWNVPFFFNKPFIVTIHDLILLHYSSRKASSRNALYYAIKHYAYKKTLEHAANNSKHILTVSDFTKNDLIKTLKIEQTKITRTYLGLTSFSANTSDSERTNPYMLYVGVQYPHKNLEFLLKVFENLTSSAAKSLDLIIAGPKGPFTKQLEKQISVMNKKCEQKKQGKIILLINQSDKAINQLYKNAKVFLFPSLYEGFGLPPVEALNRGTPVISSNVSSMPEILGDCALYANPTDIKQWIQQIESLLSNTRLQYSLVARASERFKKLSWRDCAISTIEVYKNALK